MQPQTCRAQFARLISEEAALLVVLEQQLRQEQQLLAGNDVDGLEAAGNARQQSIVSLMRIDDERRSLCRMLGYSPDATGMGQLLAWCDPQGSLASAQSDCAHWSRRCREQNERNGALVTARLNHIRGMLGMISGNDPASTYPMRNDAHAATPRPAGRMISTRA
jgi:flagellar biosynthesis protein FlgN